MRWTTKVLATLAVQVLPGSPPASAQPAASSITTIDTAASPARLPPDTIPTLLPDGRRREKAQTARSVSRAPLPHQASGIERGEPETTANQLRVLPRLLLFPARVAVEVVDAPVRGALYVLDRYELKARAHDVFFNEDGTIGLYPVAEVNSDYGLTGGARFIMRDLLDEGEQLSLRASAGGRYNYEVSAAAHTGDHLSRYVRLSGEAEYEVDPKDRFFGIGNGDEVGMPAAPVDPYTDPAAVDTRFRQRVGRVFGRARVKLFGPISVRLSSGALWKQFESPSPGDIGDGHDIADSYDTSGLTGFERGVSYGYHEVELRWDSRDVTTAYEPLSRPSTGWLIAAYAGRARDFARAPVRYNRYGGDVQRYFRLADGPRVLVLRVQAEEVHGEQEEIPFVDLPRLGGARYLRGYESDRFRDRAMALGSAEYQWDLTRSFAAYLFVDGGRVYPTLADLTVEGLRAGYGGGIQMHGWHHYLGRLNLASSIDGGVFLNLSFDPVYEPQKRLERD